MPLFAKKNRHFKAKIVKGQFFLKTYDFFIPWLKTMTWVFNLRERRREDYNDNYDEDDGDDEEDDGDDDE